MKFTPETVTRCAARLGKLTEIERLPNLTFETPLLLLYTKRGSIPHLTKDVFKLLTPDHQFLTMSLPTTITMLEFVKLFNSFSEYVSLQEYPFFLSIQDPSEPTNPGYHEKNTIAVWSRNGRYSLNAKKYMNIVETFKPDMYVTLCDGDTDVSSSQKRISKSVERKGGYNLQARENSLKYMENKPLLGYLFDGLHKCGIETQNISIDQIKPVIEHSLNLLPESKLRILMGCWNPTTLLDLVDLGIDIFDSSYPYLMSENAKALTFLCNKCDNEKKDLIDLSEKRYMDDFSPICKLCTCLTCKNHTKAYIHHLIKTKELLAQVLLMIHNIHLYINFFKSIQQHIKDGTFKEFRDEIQSKFNEKTKKI